VFATVLGIVLPVFGLVLVGYLYARRHRPDMTAASRVNLDVFTPALIFHVLSGRDFHPADYLSLALGGVLVVLGSGVVAWALSRALKRDFRTLGPPLMFNNSGNMGLPLAVLAFGETAVPAAVVLFMVENLLHFTLGVRILDRQAGLTALARMPLVLACMLGLTVSLLRIPIPQPIAQGSELLGQVAIPLMLFSLGVRLTEANLNHWGIGLVAGLARPLGGLLIALGLLPLLAMPGDLPKQLILFAVLPPAVLNYIIAERYNQEPEVVAAIVIWGNLASLVVIPLTLVAVL
jgi:malate permease and related proteins